MTAILGDPLEANPLPTYDPQPPRPLTGDSVRPFGLHQLVCTVPSGTLPTGLTYDPHQKLNVTGSGEVAAFHLPHAGTVTTINTVQDHQEWPDRVED